MPVFDKYDFYFYKYLILNDKKYFKFFFNEIMNFNQVNKDIIYSINIAFIL
ncbi:hypothetical protein MGSAQ_001179 [marine sediment metagenome]|uniref:Uncharacterized protein n=1 Tax=marine sediment metagenome TaxID=412755 RepID=A0A1B6NV47_9ZZZZ